MVMGNPDKVRSKTHRQASSKSVPRSVNRTSHLPTDSHDDGPDYATEHTPLLAPSDGHLLREDQRLWVRWPAYTVWVTKKTLLSNYINVLLIFVPLGIIAGALGWNPTLVFVLNFLAIMPLASLLSFATEELSVKLGQTLGGLLNATFGNAVELIVRVHKHHVLSYWLTMA